MEDVKWLLRRCGLPILLLLIFVIAGVVCWGRTAYRKSKTVAEEVWEPPVEIENSEAETEVSRECGNFHRVSILVYSASQ